MRMQVMNVAAGLVFRDNHILITQRPEGKHLAGLWEFPGGKLHPDESWEDCLKRELIEELDIVVDVGPLVSEILHEYPEKHVRLRFFQCTLISGEPRPIECANLAWVAAEDLSRHKFPEADASLIKQLQEPGNLWWPSSMT